MPSYYAKKPIRWGDATLNPGDPVPAGDPGRDYASAVAFGDLVEVPDATDHADRIEHLEAEVKRLRKEMKAMAKDKAPAGQEQDEAARERDLGEKGLVGSNPPLPDEQEAEAGYDDLDHAGGDAPVRGRDDDAIGEAAERQKAAGEASVKAGEAQGASGPAAVAQEQASRGIDAPAGASVAQEEKTTGGRKGR